MFSADFQFRAEGKKVTSWAEPSRAENSSAWALHWLEPARLELITIYYSYCWWTRYATIHDKSTVVSIIDGIKILKKPSSSIRNQKWCLANVRKQLWWFIWLFLAKVAKLYYIILSAFNKYWLDTVAKFLSGTQETFI